MNLFDFTILSWITRIANRSPEFDSFVAFLLNLELVKGALVMALFWGGWLGARADRQRRAILAATLVAASVALFVAACLALLLPFRPRPVVDFQVPELVNPAWREWSAFPSDHATLFFALATGLYRVLPRLGLFAFVHALVVVCGPRMYHGLHYPTDILGGAVLGILIAYLITQPSIADRVAGPPLRWMERRPGWFYASMFLTTYLVATLFTDVRRSARWLLAQLGG